jgi:hypothetical protein
MNGHLLEVVDEESGALVEGVAFAVAVAGHRPLELDVALSVQVRQGCPLLGVGDDQPAPPLDAAGRRRLHGEVEAFHDHLVLDRTGQIQSSPHRAGRGEQSVGGRNIERR